MILIVDDKPENLFSLKTILDLHSFPTDTASGGEEALKKVLRNNYALIILDVQMPGMDGFEVAETISGYSKTKDIPIIFLSAANTDKKFITKGYTSGGIDYITKPIDPDILLLKVKTFYRLYEQTRELNNIQQHLLSEIEFRKKAEAEIIDKVTELKSILESLPQIAFTTKANGQIEYVNRQWLNYAASENEFPATHEDDVNIATELQKTVTAGKALELEIRMKKLHYPLDLYRYYLLRILPITEGGTIAKWVGTFTDIDDQKQAARKKDEFISIASHELKTPLTSIKAYVQLLDRVTTEDDTSRIYVDRTLFQINKLDSLIADLLDISKIDNGKLQFNKRYFNFEMMLSNAIEMAAQTYPDYKFIRLGDAINTQVFGDDVRLEQVIANFLSNAMKYSPDIKEVVVETFITADNKLTVKVKDAGIGISKEDQEHIFRKFYRVDETAKRFEGLGIGLYICAEILRRHHCDFGVESEVGKGSTFYFSIPLNNTN